MTKAELPDLLARGTVRVASEPLTPAHERRVPRWPTEERHLPEGQSHHTTGGTCATGGASAVEFTVPGPVLGKGRPRFANGVAYTPKRTRDYEAKLKRAAVAAMPGDELLVGPLRVSLVAYMKRPKRAVPGRWLPVGKPDADNILKLIDAFNGTIWADDAQVVDARVRKVWADGEPQLVVRVEELGGGEVAF